MSTANRGFELQPSRFSFAVQLFVFICISGLSYRLIPPWIWLCLLLIMAVAGWISMRQPSVKRFEYLDGQEWSFEWNDSTLPIQRRHIAKIIDHELYITIYFANPSVKPCIVWWDQLPLAQWKKLKLWVTLA